MDTPVRKKIGACHSSPPRRNTTSAHFPSPLGAHPSNPRSLSPNPSAAPHRRWLQSKKKNRGHHRSCTRSRPLRTARRRRPAALTGGPLASSARSVSGPATSGRPCRRRPQSGRSAPTTSARRRLQVSTAGELSSPLPPPPSVTLGPPPPPPHTAPPPPPSCSAPAPPSPPPPGSSILLHWRHSQLSPYLPPHGQIQSKGATVSLYTVFAAVDCVTSLLTKSWICACCIRGCLKHTRRRCSLDLCPKKSRSIYRRLIRPQQALGTSSWIRLTSIR